MLGQPFAYIEGGKCWKKSLAVASFLTFNLGDFRESIPSGCERTPKGCLLLWDAGLVEMRGGVRLPVTCELLGQTHAKSRH